jgi:hypothetical protein
MRTPMNHKSELPPQPWFEERRRMVCWADPRSLETKAYLDRYWHFQRAFRSASAQLLAGKLDVEFPPSAFRPVTRDSPLCGLHPQQNHSEQRRLLLRLVQLYLRAHLPLRGLLISG